MQAFLFFLFAPAVLCQMCDTQTVYTTITVTAPEPADTSFAGGYQSTTAASSPEDIHPTPPSQKHSTRATATLSTMQTAATSQPTSLKSRNGGGGPVSQPSSGSSGPTYNALPPKPNNEKVSPKEFRPIQGLNKPGFAVVKNSCSYPLFVDSANCQAVNQEVAPGASFEEKFCRKTGVSMKITSAQHLKPVQLEYALDDNDLVFYDLSFLDCMVPKTTDLTGCAGHELGIQVGSVDGCNVFACQPNEYCDLTSYTVPEYGLIVGQNDKERVPVGAPNSKCTKKGAGVAIEFCASNGIADEMGN